MDILTVGFLDPNEVVLDQSRKDIETSACVAVRFLLMPKHTTIAVRCDDYYDVVTPRAVLSARTRDYTFFNIPPGYGTEVSIYIYIAVVLILERTFDICL